MGTMAISFRFKDDTSRDERYASFIDRLRKKGTVWEETTSFALVETSLTPAELEWDLWINSDFNASKDKMVVIDVTNRAASTRGPILYPATLESLMPKVVINE